MFTLEIENLTKTYANGVKALDGISLRFGKGIYGLLGPNGAGKSTFMRTLATLQLPDTGSVRFLGRDILAEPEFMRQRLGYLPQSFGAYPGHSAYSLLEYLAIMKGIRNRSERRHQIDELLQLTNLFSVRKRAVSSYSGGMKQRFGIAQALLGRPQLIITDEPTAGLDPQERNRFLDLLSTVSEQCTIILSTHIVEDVKDMCRELAILQAGRVVCQGNPGDLIGGLEEQVWQVEASRHKPYVPAPDAAVLSVKLTATGRRIRLLAASSPGDKAHAVPPSLEDVYFSTFLPSNSPDHAPALTI